METNVILPKEISTRKMSDFVNRMVDDLSAAESVKMSYLGSKMGLYKAMAFAGPMSAGDVVLRSRAPERLVEEWLKNQTGRGYIYYDPVTETYTLPTEHAIAMTDTKSPFYIAGRFQSLEGIKPKVHPTDSNKTTDAEINAAEHQKFVDGSSRFFSTEYITSLFESWLPAVEGLTSKLQTGIAVADLGCGRHGASTLVMAQAYPASSFHGFDNYESSVERANLLAKEKRVSNAHFRLATNENVHANQYDLITIIECLHSMGEIQDLLRGCYEVLKPDGVVVAVEAKDKSRIEEEHYQFLRSHVMPGAQKQYSTVEHVVDLQEKEMEEVARAAGFNSFRKVSETVYDTVYEFRI